MCKGVQALKTLGLTRTATQEEVKVAFRNLAKKWHPDKHQGGSKSNAEEQFKVLQQAYQLLSEPGGLRAAAAGPSAQPGGGAGGFGYRTSHSRRGGGGPAYDPSFRQQHESEFWGDEKRYGGAHKPGYNAHGGYMGFDGKGGGNHWYEDTASAAKKEDHSRMLRSWVGLAIFGGGLWACTYSSRRDTAAKERGELVDAWYNQNTRRWEKPLPHMRKDPMLSSLIALKPPHMVHAPSTTRQPPRKQAQTIHGNSAADAYRAREQGHGR